MDNITTIGIDVAKDFLDICVMPSKEVHRVTNTMCGFKKLLKILQRHKEVFRVVLEHTGGYQKSVVAFLQNHEFPVSVINPAQVKHFAKANGKRAKTDKIDAENLALFGLIHKPELTLAKDESVEILCQLVKRRSQIVTMLTSEKNRIEKEPCIAVRHSIEFVIQALHNELKRINEQIHELIDTNEDLRRKSDIMQSVKGIGKESAAMLLAELPELGTVGRQQIASLAGLAPMNRDSGSKKGRAFIQGGRKYARTALYMPIISAIRHNVVIRAHYENLTGHGKPKKVALIACMRKMLIYLNSLLAREIYTRSENFCLT